MVPVIYSGLFFDLLMCDNKMIGIGLSDTMHDHKPKIRSHRKKKKMKKSNQDSPGYRRKSRGVKHGRKNS